MPIFTYRQFTPDSEDMNQPGSSDVTKPSEGWKGSAANDSLRATNSALRNLGDEAAKLPRNADGSINYGPNGGDGRLGTAAFQNTGSFDNIVLGPSVRGSAGTGTLLMIVCSFVQIPTVYIEQRTRGFDLCDGRLTTNPYPPGNQIRMPNFMGRFPWFADVQNNINTFQFGGNVFPPEQAENTTTYQQQLAAQAFRVLNFSEHTHGIGGFQLTYNELPQVVTSVTPTTSGNFADGGGRGIDVQTNGVPGGGPGNSHTHAIGPSPAFSTPAFDIRPPSVAVLPFLRVW